MGSVQFRAMVHTVHSVQLRAAQLVLQSAQCCAARARRAVHFQIYCWGCRERDFAVRQRGCKRNGSARAAARPCSAVQPPLLGGPCRAVQPQWLAGPCSSVQRVGPCSSVQLRAVQKINRESNPCSAGTFLLMQTDYRRKPIINANQSSMQTNHS